ncbi:MAG: hypothetical protein DSY41_00435 [Candidatus Poseidoniales archaeon]|nr:MAG: hypothetical protein DSY41_00435 [Candidatus Poseidoniales archaeon]
MPEENLYELLQVEPTADSRSIRAAYRRLMLLHHPDRNAGVDAQEMAQRLNRAYDILRNPARRAAYDWELTGEPGEPPGNRRPLVLRQTGLVGQGRSGCGGYRHRNHHRSGDGRRWTG